MDEEMKVIPIDLKNGKYIIEIPADHNADPRDIADALNVFVEGDAGFMILSPGIKLIRIDADDVQEKT